MEKNLGRNLLFLRKLRKLQQAEMLDAIGIKATTWSMYESDKSQPNLDVLISISKYFEVSETDLLHEDLEHNAHLMRKKESDKNQENSHLISHPNAHVNRQKEHFFEEIKLTVVSEPGEEYQKKTTVIPITDISVAAGTGIYNNEYIEHLDSIKLPVNLTRKNATYIAVKVKGHSMSPTLQDSSYLIIRLLDRSQWENMADERIYVVSDADGKTFLKRVKNRFKQHFITLMSDNPDKASFPNFNLATNEIHTIWYAEWYLSAKMPNIHDQFYPRLQRLEEKVDLILKNNPKMEL